MSFDLAIYRVGGLAEQNGDAPVVLKRHSAAEVEAKFTKQRDLMLEPGGWYDKAKARISAVADADFYPRGEIPERDGAQTIIIMPPPLELLDEFDYSSHLVGLLPSERLDVKVGKVTWDVRVRASFTACALEIEDGWPKLWWTFEGVPKDPDPECRPTEEETAAFLSFVHYLEQPALKYLTKAFSDALAEVTGVGEKLSYRLADERLRIRFADNNDVEYAALIDALKLRRLSPKTLKETTIGPLENARKGMADFERFVKKTNSPQDPPIDPNTAHLETEVKIDGVEAISARRDNDNSTWIAGVAQRANSRTIYDHLAIVREQVLAENEADRVRSRSPARQLSGDLAGIEALKLEVRRRKAKHRELKRNAVAAHDTSRFDLA
jgi:hypothetical protein